MKKKILLVLMILCGFALASCGTVKHVENQLNIYCLEAGYGVSWVENIKNAFVEEDWVKEKYPDLTVKIVTNDVTTFAKSQLNAGAKTNQYDLMFCDANTIDIDDTQLYYDLTEGVYKKTIPGETRTYEEKCNESYNITNRYVEVGESSKNAKYYYAPWAGGMDGILYNEDILNALEIAVPVTTDELIAACEKIKSLNGSNSAYKESYSFIQHGGTTYWEYLFPIWWAQYEGIEGYTNFYNGIDDERISKSIFNQKGRLESLKVFEALLDYNKGYLTPASNTYEAMTAQIMFLQGQGVFHVNGDWFDSEMAVRREDIIKAGKNYTIKMMRTPIVSAIVDTLEDNEMTDATLAQVIRAIDNGATSFEGVSDDDFARLVAARGVVQSVGPGHVSIIPSYAQEAELACDFLLYMATDKANAIYIESTSGASLPFDYNVKEKNNALYQTLSPLHKNRLDYFYSANLTVSTLTYAQAFPLARYGGLREFNYPENTVSQSYRLFASQENKNPDGTNKITAQDVYDYTIKVWTNDNWNTALNKAGIQR